MLSYRLVLNVVEVSKETFLGTILTSSPEIEVEEIRVGQPIRLIFAEESDEKAIALAEDPKRLNRLMQASDLFNLIKDWASSTKVIIGIDPNTWILTKEPDHQFIKLSSRETVSRRFTDSHEYQRLAETLYVVVQPS